MEFQDLNKDMVVFSYHVSPNFGMEGDDGGFFVGIAGQRQSQVCSVSPF